MSLEKALEMCEMVDGELLYLVKFGSHLYGLNTEKSDIDYKGLYLPNKETLLTSTFKLNQIRSLNYTTGNDESRNDEKDVDIQIWALQYWLDLLSKGETSAIDMLYSITNKMAIEYFSDGLNNIFNNQLKLFNPKDAEAYIGYAIGQAKKYGIKGSRLGVVKRVIEWLNNNEYIIDSKLETILDRLIESCGDPSYCFVKKTISTNNYELDTLFLCGKQHQANISIGEFYRRVEESYNEYGKRAQEAEKNNGIDWKALSHATRACIQMKQLLTTGKIMFPFTGTEKDLLLSIKRGEKTWNETEEIIIKYISEVDNLRESDKIVTGIIDTEFIKTEILKFYK